MSPLGGGKQPRNHHVLSVLVQNQAGVLARVASLFARRGYNIFSLAVAPTDDDARTSLPLALYAAAVWKMFRRRTLRVELHHLPSGTVAGHEHTPESLARKVEQARSIARDARRADLDFAARGEDSELFPPRPGPLCGWCDVRAHCPEGRAAGPEKSDWAALEEPAHVGGWVPRDEA